MDPFLEVLQDAQHQQRNLEEFFQKLRKSSNISNDSKTDFENNLQELQETIQDLEESIETSLKNPDFFKITQSEISSRQDTVNKLKKSYQSLSQDWQLKINGNVSDTNTPFVRYHDGDDVERQDGGDEQSNFNSFNEFQQQELIREQDQHLDGVYASMQTINQQARVMGNELEEQAYIIDELDQDIDRIGSKVGRGLKRVENVIRANKEKASDCCIGLLIVILVILLIMVIVV